MFIFNLREKVYFIRVLYLVNNSVINLLLYLQTVLLFCVYVWSKPEFNLHLRCFKIGAGHSERCVKILYVEHTNLCFFQWYSTCLISHHSLMYACADYPCLLLSRVKIYVWHSKLYMGILSIIWTYLCVCIEFAIGMYWVLYVNT